MTHERALRLHQLLVAGADDATAMAEGFTLEQIGEGRRHVEYERVFRDAEASVNAILLGEKASL